MLRLHDIMTTDLVTVSAELSLRDAMDLLTNRHITGAPVVSAGKVVGVVSLTDLAEFAAGTPGIPAEHIEVPEWGEFNDPVEWIEGEEAPSAYFMQMWENASADVAERMASPEGPEWNALEEHTVSEAMNRNVISLPPDAPVELAAAMMRRLGIHRVLVIDDDALVGVVTTTDVSEAVADHLLTKRVYVFGAPAGRRGT